MAVSRVDRMRICSSASTLICCASSRTTTTVLPSAPAVKRYWLSTLISSPLVEPRRSTPRSSRMVPRSSASDRNGFRTSALPTSFGNSRRSARQSMVFPVPTSPIRAMSPFWLVIP